MSCLCDWIDVLGPGQMLRDMQTQEIEDVDSFLCHPIDEGRKIDHWISPPEVSTHLLGLANVEIIIIVWALFNHVIILPPLLWFNVTCYSLVSSVKLKMVFELSGYTVVGMERVEQGTESWGVPGLMVIKKEVLVLICIDCGLLMRMSSNNYIWMSRDTVWEVWRGWWWQCTKVIQCRVENQCPRISRWSIVS